MKKFAHEILNERIKESGWIATGVPSIHYYTVGLVDEYDAPEIAMSCITINQESAHKIISIAVEKIKNGFRFEAGQLYDGILALGYKVKVVEVDSSNYQDWFAQAFGYPRDDLRMIQFVVPDINGNYPGDDEYQADIMMQLMFDERQEGCELLCSVFSGQGTCSVCGKEGEHEH